MSGSPTEFARLLTAGIHLIRSYEGSKIAHVQEDLAEKLGLSHHSIEDWRKARNLPVQVDYVATLAREFVARAKVDPRWIERFFACAGYAAHAERYSQELFPLRLSPPPEPIELLADSCAARQGGCRNRWFSESHQRFRQLFISRSHARYIHALGAAEAEPLTIAVQQMIDLGSLSGQPVELSIYLANRVKQPMTLQTTMPTLYDDLGQALVLLSEPGAGKSTILLHLALTLLMQAQSSASQPLPLVLSLAARWSKQQSFEEWISAELWHHYRIPRKVAVSWQMQGQLALLLDGLDEVRLSQRCALVEEINYFYQEQGSPLVVTCRQAEYQQLPVKLELQSVVRMQQRIHSQATQNGRSVGSTLYYFQYATKPSLRSSGEFRLGEVNRL